MDPSRYSSKDEAKRIFDLVLTLCPLPSDLSNTRHQVVFESYRYSPYFPIPLKETEVSAALKAIEGCLACAIQDLKGEGRGNRRITINLEKVTAFLFQAYQAKIGGYGKLDVEAKAFLKNTDLLQAQSDPYRRMSANLYETKQPGHFYHIHGSLEASTTLTMLGLESFRPDLKDHDGIVGVIEPAVQRHTVDELEGLNERHGQAGIPAYKHEEFLRTPHGMANIQLPPWAVDRLEDCTAPRPMPSCGDKRPLSGIKVLELCRIIAGPVIGRTLAEYGADVLKITSPGLSDVPFFQVDGNMGKHAADIDLKTPEGRATFESLLADVDVLIDGYRPGALERLGYGPKALAEFAKARGRGVVCVAENCFGHHGEWSSRPGWQQIADCVTGVAWEQGKFMGLDEPVVPPFPISDYGTGCMGAIAALTGLIHRERSGGSWHGKVSLMQYDLLLFQAGAYPGAVENELRERAGKEFLDLRHNHSVDQISGTALRRLRQLYPEICNSQHVCDTWWSEAYKADVVTVKPVVEAEGVDISFSRASRPNGADQPTWDFGRDLDYRKSRDTPDMS